jgi:hypothetical protein
MPTLADGQAAEDPDDERFDDQFEMVEHDYDPRSEYTLRADQFDDPLLRAARERMNELAARNDTPFERGHVFPARLDEQHNLSGTAAAGIYCSGTYNEPVVLIDLDAHRALEEEEFTRDGDVLREVQRTVDHEAAHAIQEHADREGNWADEEVAEEVIGRGPRASATTRADTADGALVYARDPRTPYDVVPDEVGDEVDQTHATVNWGYWGPHSPGVDVVRWTTGEPLAREAAERLFALGEAVCAAVDQYAREVRPGDVAGVASAGFPLSIVLAGMGSGREMRLVARPLADGGFELRNYDVRDEWRAVVGPAASRPRRSTTPTGR